MPLYTCRFCDYTNIIKTKYFSHLNKHIYEHADSINPEELELCKFYRNKTSEYSQKHYHNNKEKRTQWMREYYLRKKLEKQQVEDIDELIISDSD